MYNKDHIFKKEKKGCSRNLLRTSTTSKKIQSETKDTLIEIKNNLQGIKSRVDEVKSQINDLEYKQEKDIQSGQ